MRRTVLTMLLAPLLVLVEQSFSYSLVTPLCQRQAGVWLHAVPALFTLVVAWMALAAVHEVRRLAAAHGPTLPDPPPPDTDRHAPQRLMLARVAAGIALLSLLSMLALWLPLWVLSPCLN